MISLVRIIYILTRKRRFCRHSSGEQTGGPWVMPNHFTDNNYAIANQVIITQLDICNAGLKVMIDTVAEYFLKNIY